MLWLGDHLRSASHLDILLVGLGCLISIPECRRLAAGVVILTMTFEGLLLGLPKRPDGGRLPCRYPVRRRELPADRGTGTGGAFDLSQGEDYSGAPTACRAGLRPYHPPSHSVAFAQRAAYCQGWYGDGRAREGARHRADWLSRIDLAGAGVRVEAVDAVGGGDLHVDSVVRTRVRPVGLAPRRCCRVVRGFEPRSGPQ